MDNGRRPLHELTHRAGHTLVLLGGPTTRGPELAPLLAALQDLASGSVLLETALAFSAGPDLADRIGRLEPAAVDLLGVRSTTLFAVSPDGYFWLGSDRDHLKALEQYSTLIVSGHP